MNETATVHRYQGHDEDRSHIPDGTLVAVTSADYDDEKSIVWFTLPGLHSPQCSAYTEADLGPELATIEIMDRGEDPWGMVPADPSVISSVVEAAESEEQRVAAIMADPWVISAIATLRGAGVTAAQYAAAVAASGIEDDS